MKLKCSFLCARKRGRVRQISSAPHIMRFPLRVWRFIMMNSFNSIWVVLFTREVSCGDWDLESCGLISSTHTQAFFVGNLKECLDFCKRYAGHEAGWERSDFMYPSLYQSHHAVCYSKWKLGKHWEDATCEMLTLDRLPT